MYVLAIKIPRPLLSNGLNVETNRPIEKFWPQTNEIITPWLLLGGSALDYGSQPQLQAIRNTAREIRLFAVLNWKQKDV